MSTAKHVGLATTVSPAAPVAVRMPKWIAGGNPRLLGPLCGWKLDPIDESQHLWSVQTTETVRGAQPALLDLFHFGPVSGRQMLERYEKVSRLREYDPFQPDGGWVTALELDERVSGANDPSIFVLLSSARNLVSAAPDASMLQKVLPSIATDRLRPGLPSASVWLLTAKPELTGRYATARALLRSKDDPADLAKGTSVIQSSRHLFADTTMGLGAYVAPLFSSLSPYVWGMKADRGGGSIFFQFGQLLEGTNPQRTDLLDILAPERLVDSPPLEKPDVGPAHMTATMKWWFERLDLVLGEATNLSNYTSKSGEFSPQMMVEKLLNLEQCFRHCQTLATLRGDNHALRLVTLTALESFGGASTQFSWTTMYDARRVETMLDKLEAALPEKVKAMLLPRARRGLDALRAVQDGFFVGSRRTASGEILVADKNGTLAPVAPEAAGSAWLRVLRNSHHGFDREPSLRDRDLLAIHDGSVPDGLIDLPWLALVFLLAFPDTLRRGTR